MGRWIRVGGEHEFREARGRLVDVEGTAVAVFRLGGAWYAIRDACPHMGASLADGLVHGRNVICHWHQWRFDLATGASPDHSRICAVVYPTRVEDGAIWVEAPEPPPAPEEEPWVPFDPQTHLRRPPG